MLFNSLEFLIFFPIVVAAYFILPKKLKQFWLLIASYYFYMCWNAKYIFLIFFSTMITYGSGLLLEKIKTLPVEEKRRTRYKKLTVAFSFLLNLSVLCYFKYMNYFFSVIAAVFHAAHIELNVPAFDILLPVGISFYTFQALSYTMDVYRDEIYAEKNFFRYALFVSFFPQLVAGPIERTDNLLPQIKEEHCFRYGDAVYGLRQMLWGFFKKVVIADTLANYVDLVYDSPTSRTGGVFLIAAIFFSIQIYCDFSGYSDIAIGTARLFGIRLMTNFKSPYLSSSVNEFWRRWHISLSTWFRDYVYIPLGGNRKGRIRKYINTLITFLLSGLWHGANGTFIFWGGLHGCVQIVEDVFGLNKKKRFRYLSMAFTFLFITFAWIFFRADTLQEAGYIIRFIFDGISSPVTYIRNGFAAFGIGRKTYIRIGISLMVLLIFDWISLHGDPLAEVSKLPGVIRWGIYYLFGTILIVYGFNNVGENPFVYFQF